MVELTADQKIELDVELIRLVQRGVITDDQRNQIIEAVLGITLTAEEMEYERRATGSPLNERQAVLEQARQWSTISTTSASEFDKQLTHWYREFQSGYCSLGYAADQLGMNKIDLMSVLDRLGWPVSNM